MTKELQDRLLRISSQEGQPYPCGNQIVSNLIILKSSSRIEAFERAYPSFVCYRRGKDVRNNRYINAKTEELWRVIILSDNARGYRAHKAIIDSTIDDELINTVGVALLQPLYCSSIELF